MATAATYNIEITISDGNISYSPEGFTQRVHRGDRIRWHSAHPFAVTFGERTPLENNGLAGGPNTDAAGTIRPNAASGAYKYSVAVFAQAGAAPLIDDPELYVD